MVHKKTGQNLRPLLTREIDNDPIFSSGLCPQRSSDRKSRDTAVTARAIILAATTTSTLVTYWTFQRSLAAMNAAMATLFLVA